MKILITLLLLALSLSLKAQKDIFLLRDWKSHTFPSGKDTLLAYNHSSAYRVYIENNRVKAQQEIYGKKDDLPFNIEVKKPGPNQEFYSPFAGTRTVLKVDDGYLVGFNNGEFTGSLSWFSSDGKEHYIINRVNLQQFILREGKIFAIEGLSHMSFNDGTMLQIEKKDAKWCAATYLKLPSAPRAITTDASNRFLIATASQLLSVDEKLNISSLHENKDWLYYLHPNSIVCHNKTVYVGMRGGVFSYDLKTGKQSWLIPDK